MVSRRAVTRRRATLPFCTLVNPRAHEADLFCREFLLLARHLGNVGMNPGENLHYETLGAFSGRECRPVIAALERKLTSVQSQARLLFLLTVTIVTSLDEQRLQVLGEASSRSTCLS